MRDRLAWRFDAFELDLPAWRLARAGQPVALEPKALALLELLIERRGEVVTKTEILDEVWKDAAVTENAMVRVVAQLRTALGDDSKHPRYIETVHTRGYRFVHPVVTLHEPATATASSAQAREGPIPEPPSGLPPQIDPSGHRTRAQSASSSLAPLPCPPGRHVVSHAVRTWSRTASDGCRRNDGSPGPRIWMACSDPTRWRT